MSEELEIFLEDCEDQLQSMENALVEIQNSGVSSDSIDDIFRTMHTIKGSAGMFGFSEIVTFAHTAENLLDEVRQGLVEATPEQVINWTKGQVIIATGSPFPPVIYQGKSYPIAQCNNSYIFPGIGLGVVAANINRITDEMFMVASETLAKMSPLANTGKGELLPPLTGIAELSKKIAFAVAKVAFKQGLALEISDEMLSTKITQNFWQPEYRQYRRSSI